MARIVGARGETEIQVPDGDVVRLLYTNRALVDAERSLGQSIIGIAEGFTQNRSGLSEILVLLQAGMEAARHDAREGGRRVSERDAEKVMDAVGFAGVVGPVMEGVCEVLSFDPNSDDDADSDADDPNE